MHHHDLTQAATAIAAELRMTLEAASGDEPEAFLISGDGRLHLYLTGDRIHVTGWFPPTQHPGTRERPEISVRFSRGPAVIAREINRLLLPRYQETLTEVLARNVADASDTAARSTLAAEIITLFAGGPSRVVTRQDTSSHAVHLDTACGSGLVRIYGDGARTYLELRSLPAPVTMRMLTILAAATALEPASS